MSSKSKLSRLQLVDLVQQVIAGRAATEEQHAQLLQVAKDEQLARFVFEWFEVLRPETHSGADDPNDGVVSLRRLFWGGKTAILVGSHVAPRVPLYGPQGFLRKAFARQFAWRLAHELSAAEHAVLQLSTEIDNVGDSRTLHNHGVAESSDASQPWRADDPFAFGVQRTLRSMEISLLKDQAVLIEKEIKNQSQWATDGRLENAKALGDLLATLIHEHYDEIMCQSGEAEQQHRVHSSLGPQERIAEPRPAPAGLPQTLPFEDEAHPNTASDVGGWNAERPYRDFVMGGSGFKRRRSRYILEDDDD
ncbi:uncharacterized protein RCC_02254 [Ramularia collo-cygni]|uniref:Uncharacterized protein n=1 Tax=Ramularia collo-cygni TaxID=112498 RepID=A0A2D3UNH3_9PEZI|nr:uncharacterized protein RCC_02254 [Ramularia collo-cygni]CZT16411.1 uncharacterized protein RCC_02254 [Ramularia collo-cygni]